MRSANIPEGAHNPNGYTEEEVLHELRGLRGSRKVSFRYEHLDKDLNRIKDLDNVLGGSVQMSYTSGIKRTAKFTLRGDNGIDFLHDYIKPWYRLHMPPAWTEETQEFTREWDNSFDSSATGAATYDNVDALGSALETISGDVTLTDTVKFDLRNTIELGDPGTGSTGYILSPVSDLSGNLRRFQALMYFETGADHQNIWRDGIGNFFGGGGGAEGGFAVNGSISQVLLSGNDVSAAVYSNIADTWVRVEIDFDYSDKTVYYRFYWTDPRSGTTADYEFDTTFTTDQKVHGFEVEKLSGASGSAVYLSRTSLGDVVTLPPRPNPSDDDWVEWPLGVFMLSTPTQTASGGVVTREIEAYDRSKIFTDDKLTERLHLEKGQNYTDLMNQVIDSIDSTIPRIIEPSDYVVGRTRDIEVGTEKKEVLDRLAEAINYHTMQVDEDGVVIYRPYISPSDRTPEFDYSDNEISIMYDDVESEFDIYEIANVWIVSLSETEEDPVYVKLENHDPANPFSIERRGRRIVDYREQEEGVDPSTIATKVRRLQFEANRVYENIDFSTLTNPLHSVNDCYTINFSDLNISNKYTETGWEMSLEPGAEMTHSARRDVRLDPELFDGFVDAELEVTGSLTAGNMAWGKILVPVTKTNVPQSVAVTGLDLKGTGRVEVFVTPETTAPHNVKGVTSQDESPTGFTIWLYRATMFDTTVHWLALRKV